MEILIILIPVSLLLSFAGLLGFFWAVKDGQYDDLNEESEKILKHDKKI